MDIDLNSDEPLPMPYWDLFRHPPEKYWGYLVVCLTTGQLVYMLPEQIKPEDSLCFYDGDYSDVLEPTDPAVAWRFTDD